MLELRTVSEKDARIHKSLADLGMVEIGRTIDGEIIYDCCNSVDIGNVISSGLRRYEKIPWRQRRSLDRHKWSGEK